MAKLIKCDKKALTSAIAHLNGYSNIINRKIGVKPIAVEDNIKRLKKMRSKC